MNFRDFLNISKICDAHIHLADLYDFGASLVNSPDYSCISCSHSKREFDLQTEFTKAIPSDCKPFIISSFGIHPQNPDLNLTAFLEELLKDKKIGAIGETGFDYFTSEFKATSKIQEEAFIIQTELACKYEKPLIIHSRKAIEKLFSYSKLLSKVPFVVFHSFPGTLSEALSLLNHGINGLFSFSSQILKGNKKSIECVKNLPQDKLLFETDAPYQTLKDEKITLQERILDVYIEGFKIRTCKEASGFSSAVCDDMPGEFFDFVQLVNANFDLLREKN